MFVKAQSSGLSSRAGSRKMFKVLPALLVTMMLVSLFSATTASAAGSSDFSFASGAFRKVWERSDLPVAAQKATRSFTWGPEGWTFVEEPYEESPGGKRLVQYFDKTRMEITDSGTKNVTNGLLVKEMVSGQVQEGNAKFRGVGPANSPVAGDALNNIGPTYATFRNITTLEPGQNTAPRRSGEIVKTTINRDAVIGDSDNYGDVYGVKYQEYNPELGHNIPDVFWSFLTQRGTVYQNGNYVQSEVIDWVATMGFPIAEPYWARVTVGGAEKDVLIQLYERRVLTYTPDNPASFKVEMGNVGAQYYAWRYNNGPRVAPWAKVTIYNKTDCNAINVTYNGPDELSIDLKINDGKVYNFAPGSYSYTISGCNYRPYNSSTTFQPNGEYDSTIVIR